MISCQSDSTKKSTYTLSHMGSLEEWRYYVFEDPKVPTTSGKCFLKERMNLTGMEVSLNVLSPGDGIPFYHKHQDNEELYIFIKGRGQFQVDGKVFDVKEGSVVRVAPEGVRAFRNHSEEDLYFIVVQAREGCFSGENISDGVGAGSPVEW